MSVKTDSTPVEDPKDPEACNVFALLRLMAAPEEVKEWVDRYRKGGMGYGDAKKRVAELFEDVFGPARERREKLAADPDAVEDVLCGGAKIARAIAEDVMSDVREACGITTAKGVAK